METLVVVLLLALFFGAGYLIYWAGNFYTAAARPMPGARYASLDGLRGFLALGVFLCHADATYHYAQSGAWHATAHLPRLMGASAVYLFFMITGFLFWLRILRAGTPATGVPPGGWRAGVQRRLASALQLYRGRFLRIVPLYLFSASVLLGIVLYRTGGPHRGDLPNFAAGTARLLLGCGLASFTPINGLNPETLNAGVLWTLPFEWWFYLLLPVLALLARPGGLLLLGTVLAGLYYQLHGTPWPCVLFLCGMTAAQLIHVYGPQRWASGPIATGASIALLVIVLVGFEKPCTVRVFVLLFGVIYALVNGGTFGGLLTTPAAQVLGSMSYSIYLLHGIVLYLARPLLRHFVGTGDPGLQYWLMIGAVGLGTIALSAVTYRFIEHPFMVLEQRLKHASRPQTVAGVTGTRPTWEPPHHLVAGGELAAG